MIIAILPAAGCAAFTPVDVAKPSDISLEDATLQVAKSFVETKNYLDANKREMGMIIDEVDVDFNVTAGAFAERFSRSKDRCGQTSVGRCFGDRRAIRPANQYCPEGKYDPHGIQERVYGVFELCRCNPPIRT